MVRIEGKTTPPPTPFFNTEKDPVTQHAGSRCLKGEFRVLCMQRDKDLDRDAISNRRPKKLPGRELDLRKASASFVNEIGDPIEELGQSHAPEYAIDYNQDTWAETKRSDGTDAILSVRFPAVHRFRAFKFTLGPGLLESAHDLKRHGKVWKDHYVRSGQHDEGPFSTLRAVERGRFVDNNYSTSHSTFETIITRKTGCLVNVMEFQSWQSWYLFWHQKCHYEVPLCILPGQQTCSDLRLHMDVGDPRFPSGWKSKRNVLSNISHTFLCTEENAPGESIRIGTRRNDCCHILIYFVCPLSVLFSYHRFPINGVCSGKVMKVRRAEKPIRRLKTHVHEVLPCLKLCLKEKKCDAVNFLPSEKAPGDVGGLCYLTSTTAHKQGVMHTPQFQEKMKKRKQTMEKLGGDIEVEWETSFSPTCHMPPQSGKSSLSHFKCISGCKPEMLPSPF